MRVATRLAGGLFLFSLLLALAACGTLTGSDEIADLETQNAQLQGTIEVLGTPQLTIEALALAATQNERHIVQLTQAQFELFQANSTLTVLELTGGIPGAAPPAAAALPAATAAPAAPPGDQAVVLPTPTTSPTRVPTTFSGTVIGTGLDDDDCATGVAARFDVTNLTRLFVDTRIDYLPAGSLVGARWYVNGQLFFDEVECWIPQEDYYDICAWCAIDPDGPTFPTGIWTVELYLNNQMLSQTRFELIAPALE